MLRVRKPAHRKAIKKQPMHYTNWLWILLAIRTIPFSRFAWPNRVCPTRLQKSPPRRQNLRSNLARMTPEHDREWSGMVQFPYSGCAGERKADQSAILEGRADRKVVGSLGKLEHLGI